mmetsp:Transcript_15226/g.16933  ORF Transcript_15226/g.16933 Transcript_15226/m.16933 type:complete len:434 (+) Transcript_15226:89-1390(+)
MQAKQDLYICAPWMREYNEKGSQGAKEDHVMALHREVDAFAKWVAPTPAEHRMRREVFDRVKNATAKLWPAAKVELYGSFVTGVCVPMSDMDVVIFDAKGDTYGPSSATALHTLAQALVKQKIAIKVEVISTARIPIIKYIDAKTHILVDVTFECYSAPANVLLVNSILQEYPPTRPLALVIKFYLKLLFLNDKWTGGIGSFPLLAMVTSYLQHHTKSRGRSSTYTADYNFGSMLLGFFKYWAEEHDYIERGVSILESGSYFSKKERGWYNPRAPTLLCIEDPYNPEEDIGCPSFRIDTIKHCFTVAYTALSTNDACAVPYDSWLSKLLVVPADVMSHRRWANHNYSNRRKNKQNNSRKPPRGGNSSLCGRRENRQHSSGGRDSNKSSSNGSRGPQNAGRKSGNKKSSSPQKGIPVKINSIEEFPALATKTWV